MKRIFIVLFICCINMVCFAEEFVTHVTVTTYNPTAAQCGSNPSITANGTKVDLNKLKNGSQRIVAISRDLLWCIPMNSIIEIEGYGQFVVADTMGMGKTHYIDILQHPSKENFKKEKIKVKVIRKGKQNNCLMFIVCCLNLCSIFNMLLRFLIKIFTFTFLYKIKAVSL